MKALFKHHRFSDQLQRLGYTQSSQVHLTVDGEYEIYTVAMWSWVIMFLVINDLELPYWVPSSLFLVTNKQPRSDWIFNELDDEVIFVLGPEFIAREKATYKAMVESHPDAIENFWRYVEKNQLLDF